jgi:hypothetical protein
MLLRKAAADLHVLVHSLSHGIFLAGFHVVGSSYKYSLDLALDCGDHLFHISLVLLG